MTVVFSDVIFFFLSLHCAVLGWCHLLHDGRNVTWDEAFESCKKLGGYLIDSSSTQNETLGRLPGITKDDYFWTSMRREHGHMYSLKDCPSYWESFLNYTWIDVPLALPLENCVKYNVFQRVWGVAKCSDKLKALCFQQKAEPQHEECSRQKPLARVSNNSMMNETRFSGNVLVNKDNFTSVSLVCELNADTERSKNKSQHIVWVKDGVYLEGHATLIHLSDVRDKSNSDFTKDGYTYALQGTYWCESWYTTCIERVQSNTINIIFTDVDTVVIHIQKTTKDPDINKFIKTEFKQIKQCLNRSRVEYKVAYQNFKQRTTMITSVAYLHIYLERATNLNSTAEEILLRNDQLKNICLEKNHIKNIYFLTTCNHSGTEWKSTRAGTRVYINYKNLCLSCNMGQYNKSAFWSELHVENCKMLYKKDTIIQQITPTDIVKQIQYLEANYTEPTKDLIQVITEIAQIDSETLLKSQNRYNTTTRLLEITETILFEGNSSKNKTFHGRVDQTQLSFTSVEINQSKPLVGFSSRGGNEALSLYDYNISSDVKVAILFPEGLINNYSIVNTREPKAGFAVFENASLLNSSYSDNYKLNNVFFIAALRNITVQHVDTPIQIYFAIAKTHVNDAKCVYWEIRANNGSGWWIDHGCKNNGTHRGLLMCVCTHLTAFSLLIKIQNIDKLHETHLSIISIIGCSLSLFGLSVVIVSFLLFRKWRDFTHSKILVSLCISLLGVYVLFLAGFNYTSDQNICMIVAVLLHYLILSSFCWMFVEAIHQYLRFVKVVGTYIPRFMIKASLGAWGIPIIPIITMLIYNRNVYGNDKYCWIDMEVFYPAFLGPLAILLTGNIIVFILILRSTTCERKNLRTNQSQYKLNMMRFRMSVTVFVLLGLNWVFGFLSYTESNDHLVFTYLFSITSSVQGFILFVLFILREERTKDMWKSLIVSCCRKNRNVYNHEMNLKGQKLTSETTNQDSTSITKASSTTEIK